MFSILFPICNCDDFVNNGTTQAIVSSLTAVHQCAGPEHHGFHAGTFVWSRVNVKAKRHGVFDANRCVVSQRYAAVSSSQLTCDAVFSFLLSDPSFLRCRHLEGSLVKKSVEKDVRGNGHGEFLFCIEAQPVR